MVMFAVVTVMTCFVCLAMLLPVWMNKRKPLNGTLFLSNSCLSQPE